LGQAQMHAPPHWHARQPPLEEGPDRERRLQPVRRNHHHRHCHHRHSKVDGRCMRSRVRIGAWAWPGCRPVQRLVLGHHGHRVTKGAGAERGRDGEAPQPARLRPLCKANWPAQRRPTEVVVKLEGPPPVVLSQKGALGVAWASLYAPPAFVCEGTWEWHGCCCVVCERRPGVVWALLYTPPAFVCEDRE
jgi:hypothetical protein